MTGIYNAKGVTGLAEIKGWKDKPTKFCAKNVPAVVKDGVLGMWCSEKPDNCYDKDGKVQFPIVVQYRPDDSDMGKLLAKRLAEFEADACYEITITFDTDNPIGGKALTTDALYEAIKDDIVGAKKLGETPKELTDWKPAEGNGGGKQYKTPKERAADRIDAFSFVCSEIGAKKLDETLTVVIGREPNESEMFQLVLALIS